MRKFIIGLGIFAFFAIMSLSQAINPGDSTINTKGEQNVQYELQCSFSSINDTSDTVMTYKTKSPIATVESVEKIGNKFGFVNSSASNVNSGTVEMFDGKKHLLVYEKSGAIWYAMPSKIDPVVNSQPNLPNDETAKKLAADFLVSTNCLPQDAKFKDVVADKQITAKKGSNTIIQDYNVTLQVRYQRDINGIPVVGPGNKLKVFIGDNNEVVGMFKVWRDVVPDTKIKIKTPEKAYSDLQASNDVVVPIKINGSKIRVKNMTLGYWMEPADKEQTKVLPVYIFKGDVIDSTGNNSAPYEGYIYATQRGLI